MSSDDIAQRLASLRHYFGKFTLVSDIVSVRGSVKDGFLLTRTDGVTIEDAGTITPPEDNCPELTLICDSISASRSKQCVNNRRLTCGGYWDASTPSHDGICYASVDFQPVPPGPAVYSDPVDCSTCFQKVEIKAGDCACLSGGAIPFITWSFLPADGYTGGDDPFAWSSCGDCSSFFCPGSVIGPYSIQFSDPFTTASLISDTVAALPAYADCFGCDESSEGCSPLIDGQGCDCSASRFLSEDETSYTVERFKPKFTFVAQSFAFTITYNEHFAPDVGSPTDTPRTISVGIGDTEAFGDEVLEPSTNGTITITDVTCTIP